AGPSRPRRETGRSARAGCVRRRNRPLSPGRGNCREPAAGTEMSVRREGSRSSWYPPEPEVELADRGNVVAREAEGGGDDRVQLSFFVGLDRAAPVRPCGDLDESRCGRPCVPPPRERHQRDRPGEE